MINCPRRAPDPWSLPLKFLRNLPIERLGVSHLTSERG